MGRSQLSGAGQPHLRSWPPPSGLCGWHSPSSRRTCSRSSEARTTHWVVRALSRHAIAPHGSGLRAQLIGLATLAALESTPDSCVGCRMQYRNSPPSRYDRGPLSRLTGPPGAGLYGPTAGATTLTCALKSCRLSTACAVRWATVPAASFSPCSTGCGFSAASWCRSTVASTS